MRWDELDRLRVGEKGNVVIASMGDSAHSLLRGRHPGEITFISAPRSRAFSPGFLPPIGSYWKRRSKRMGPSSNTGALGPLFASSRSLGRS